MRKFGRGVGMDKTVFIVIGYIVFTLYTVGIMFFGVLLEKKTGIDKLICRKLTHIVSAFIWVICYFFFGCSIHWIILNATGAVLLGFITLSPKFKAFGREDADKSPGMFYFALSTFVVAVICYIVGEELYLYTGIAYYCLALGDGFAPIVAKCCKKNPEIARGKTVFGTLSVFAVSFLASAVFSAVFKMDLDVLFLLSVAALTCVVEFYGFKGTDNLFIEFLVFGYLLFNHYGLNSVVFEIVVLLSPLLACLVVGKKKMTKVGGAIALVVFYSIAFFGKTFVPVLFVTGLFVIEGVCSIICDAIARKKNTDKDPPRTGRQIVAVGLIGCTFLIVYYFTGRPIYYYAFALSFIGQFVDSIASEVGQLTHGLTVSIITGKPTDKGVSGGVSALGTAAAFCSAFLLAYFFKAVDGSGFFVFLLLGAFAFIECLADSVLGWAIQAAYVCGACGKRTEIPVHCGVAAKKVKGLGFVDNSTVNLLSGIIACAAFIPVLEIVL